MYVHLYRGGKKKHQVSEEEQGGFVIMIDFLACFDFKLQVSFEMVAQNWLCPSQYPPVEAFTCRPVLVLVWSCEALILYQATLTANIEH